MELGTDEADDDQIEICSDCPGGLMCCLNQHMMDEEREGRA